MKKTNSNGRLFLLFCTMVMTTGPTAAQIYAKTNYSPTYEEIISFYRDLDKKYPQAVLKEVGQTDIGLPLHVLNIKGSEKKGTQKTAILINNGIHPGEPDGINASMHLADEILGNWKKYQSLFDTIDLHIIAVYNVDGCLRRSSTSRVNQEGPAEYGFRGNYQNLDLNRDFIKMDSRNAFAFAQIFHEVDPHLLVDTHVSNGADYQYTFTCFFTEPAKLPAGLGQLSRNMEKWLTGAMLKKGIDVVPYVNHHGPTPLGGIVAFNDHPRYCTGYAALFNCVGITTETHMLKPFDERVKTTYEALWQVLKMGVKYRNDLLQHKKDDACNSQNQLGLQYELDTTQYDRINFKGYEHGYKKSEVSGLQQLYYDRTKAYEREIRYYNHYLPNLVVELPKAYIVPQAWNDVIERLKANRVVLKKIGQDTLVEVECYIARKAGVGANPYEGHYYHGEVEVEKVKYRKKFFKGDYLVSCNGRQKRFVAEVLEPQAVDSYFRWNMFDACLQQKEWFSDYVFDSKATDILAKDGALKQKLEEKKAADTAFAQNHFEQLLFVYRNSLYYEGTAWEIPVYRVF